MRNYNPSWEDEPFCFDVLKPKDLNTTISMRVNVLDWDRLKSNNIIGSVSIPESELNMILNAREGSDESIKELEMVLEKKGKPVYNAVGSPSILKIRLKQIGKVLSGCEIKDLKNFFLEYDADNDGKIDEEEFAEMLKKILPVTMLFTGTECGDSILKTLSMEQIRALLKNDWMASVRNLKNDDSLTGKLKFILNGIQDESRVDKYESSGEKDIQSARDGEKEIKSAMDCVKEQGRHSDHEKVLTLPTEDRIPAETIEGLQDDLEFLANQLRRYGIITLPPLIWDADSAGSSERTALR
jgi:Ca2+-binding EF-hand superfamily protein